MHSSPRRHTGNWGPRGSQADMQGLGVTWLLDCAAPGALSQIPSPNYGKIVPLPCGCLGRGKGYGSKPRQKIRSGAPKAAGQRTAFPSGSSCSQGSAKCSTRVPLDYIVEAERGATVPGQPVTSIQEQPMTRCVSFYQPTKPWGDGGVLTVAGTGWCWRPLDTNLHLGGQGESVALCSPR